MTEEHFNVDKFKTLVESEEETERDCLTLNIPLDPAHKRMDVALREQLEGKPVSVEDLISNAIAPQAEQELYKNLQNMKYSEQ